MSKKISQLEKNIKLFSREKTYEKNDLAMELFGSFHSHLTKIEALLGGTIYAKGNKLTISGNPSSVDTICHVLDSLYARLQNGLSVDLGEVDAAIRMTKTKGEKPDNLTCLVKTKKGYISPRSNRQLQYLESISKKNLVFGEGPAGTGKTFLAVAVAVEKLISGEVDRIVLSRPAVEAGEQLGFLPGDMKEKVDPYLRPLYDALHNMMPEGKVSKFIENGEIEIAPLAFMRGRTLSNAFVILDEAQNTTSVQMKMFLTRLGEGSQMVVTGDLSQIDLPNGIKSGLNDALETLSSVKGVKIINFKDSDVVRNSFVARIVSAYRKIETRRLNRSKETL